MTQACEDGNSNLVEVVTVVDVDDEKRVTKLLWQAELNPRVRCAFGNVFILTSILLLHHY